MGMHCPVTVFSPQTGASLQRPVFQATLVQIFVAKTISDSVIDSETSFSFIKTKKVCMRLIQK